MCYNIVRDMPVTNSRLRSCSPGCTFSFRELNLCVRCRALSGRSLSEFKQHPYKPQHASHAQIPCTHSTYHTYQVSRINTYLLEYQPLWDPCIPSKTMVGRFRVYQPPTSSVDAQKYGQDPCIQPLELRHHVAEYHPPITPLPLLESSLSIVSPLQSQEGQCTFEVSHASRKCELLGELSS